MIEITQPTLFVPGTHCDERVWLPLWQQLNFAPGTRMYAPLQWANTREDMLTMVNDRLHATESGVHVVGFSMGGFIAALCALESVERISRLTLIGYNPQGLSDTEVKQRKSIISSIEKGQYRPMAKSRMLQFFTQSELDNSDASSIVDDMGKDLGGSTLKAHMQATTPREDLTKALDTFKKPIHFVTAEHDKIADAEVVRHYCNANKNSQFTCLRDTAHMMLLTQPQRAAQAIFGSPSR